MISSVKIAIRNLLNNGYYTIINITGLMVGIASFLLIMVYVWDEWSYDRHHEHAKQIYRVVNVYNQGGIGEESSGSPFPLGPAIKKAYPEKVKDVTRIFNFQRQRHILHVDTLMYEESRIYFADSAYFGMFNHTFIKGNASNALAESNSIVLTRSKAIELFGSLSVLGKIIKYENRIPLHITGVIEDVIPQSHFVFDGLVSFLTLEYYYDKGLKKTDWIWNPCWTYILTYPNVTQKTVEDLLPEFVYKHFPENNRKLVSLYLQPLTDIHLKSHIDYEIAQNSTYLNVVILFFIALVILFAAIINYINLTTASSVKRAKEISIKKIMGASNRNILFQFLLESILMSLVALIISLAIAEWILPNYGILTGKDFTGGLKFSFPMVIFVLSVGLLTGLAAGVYPAIQLSGFDSMAILRRRTIINNQSAFPRKILVTFQTTISIVLIVTSFGLLKQYHFVTSQDLGIDYKNTLIANTEYSRFAYLFDEIRDSLLTREGVVHVTGFNYVPGVEHNLHPYEPEGKTEDKYKFYPAIQVRQGFFETYGIKFLAGEPYGEKNKNGIIINKALVDYLDWGKPEDAIGRKFSFMDWERNVIGVTQNFNVTSLHDSIVPFVIDMQINERWLVYFTRFMAVKIKPEKESEVLEFLQSYWNTFHPERPFIYDYHKNKLDDLYSSEQILIRMIMTFTLISIFIATIGMLGLTSYLTEQRTREIGIRKAAGAFSSDIISMMVKEYIPLCLISTVIAWPMVIAILNFIMQDMAYRVSIGPTSYLLPTLATLLVMILTIILQSMKAANKNPVDALRDE